MNKDQVKGRAEEAAGRVKEVTGRLLGNKEMVREGKGQQSGGMLLAGFGDIKENLRKSAP